MSGAALCKGEVQTLFPSDKHYQKKYSYVITRRPKAESGAKRSLPEGDEAIPYLRLLRHFVPRNDGIVHKGLVS